MIRNGAKYISVIAGTYAAFELLLNASVHRGLEFPKRNPLYPNQWMVDERVMSRREWRDFLRRPDVLLAITYVFVTAGPTATLPSDFNINSNTISAIGAGAAGPGGFPATGPDGSGNFTSGQGRNGGGAGAFAQISNYSAHGAGAVVNVQVGTGDTWFDSTSVLLAKGGVGRFGGTAASSVGTVVFDGGGGGRPGAGITGPAPGGGGGGGGGGAAGPHGAGNTAADGSNATATNAGPGGGGAAGDAGTTPANSNGSQFDATHGSGGGGDGGAGGDSANLNGRTGLPGGSYGAGGGGGGGGGSNGITLGNGGTGGGGFQGLIAIAYTPATSGVRSYGFVIG